MLLQVPHVLNVGASAQPSRGAGLSFDGDGFPPEPTGVRCRQPCRRSDP